MKTQESGLVNGRAIDIVFRDGRWLERIDYAASVLGERYIKESTKLSHLALSYMVGLALGVVIGVLFYAGLSPFLP